MIATQSTGLYRENTYKRLTQNLDFIKELN